MKDIHSYSIFSEGTEKQVVWYPDTKISEHRKISHIARSLKEPRVGSPRPRESTAGLQATTMNVFTSSRSPQQLPGEH